jgi:photosystem II stability/assembly factor-like uncharacterized protein
MATMTLNRAQVRLLPLLMAVSVLGTGCGSMSKLIGGKKGKTAARHTADRTPQLITSFTIKADPQTGEFTVQAAPEAGTSASGAVRQQATQFTRAWDLSLTGQATYTAATHILSGDVTLSSNHSTTFQNVKCIVTSISATDVSVTNADGVTDLTGANKPYWAFGELPGPGNATRNWQFNVPSGVSFSFSIAVYADVFSTPPGDGGTIQAMAFIPGNPAKGWAVGQGGKILHTTDGGLNWTAQISNVSFDLRDVNFVNSEQGWIVGAGATILVTSNGGKTWRRQETFLDPMYQLNGVSFVSPSTGYAVGLQGLVLRTFDGGQSWSFTFQADGDDLYDVDAVGSQVWAVGTGGTVIASFDDGESWMRQELPWSQLPFSNPAFNPLFCVDFVDANNGWIGGIGGIVLRTSNGGADWQRQYLDSNTFYRPNVTDVAFISASQGWVTITEPNGHGTVYRTTNGGSTWTEATLPIFGVGLQAVAAVDAQHVWVGGNGGIVLLTQDGGGAGGGNWFTFVSGTTAHLNDVCFPSRSRGYAVGEAGTIMRTTDGGRTWQQLGDAPFMDLYGVHFLNDDVGWAVGQFGYALKTTNGGQSWEQLATPAFGQTLYATYWIDQNKGWIVGQGGTILSTNDGGQNWNFHAPQEGPAGTLYDVRFQADGVTGYIVGEKGTVLMTFDGATWNYSYASTNDALYGIGTAPDGSAWLVGLNSVIRKLDPGSMSWNGQNPGFIDDIDTAEREDLRRVTLRAVEFIDPNRGYIVGNTGTMLRTMDGGNTWTPIEGGTIRELLSIDFFDEDLGAAVGRNGVIKTFR